MKTAVIGEMTDARMMESPFGWWLVAAASLLLIGLATRLIPVLLGGDLLYRQFMTEDGYLMLTVARNISLGKGMSIADGTIPTNGVQPLATYLYAMCFWLANGERTAGLVYVHLLSIAVAVGTSVLIVSVARSMVPEVRWGWTVGLLAAGLWFSAPLILQHSMNGLETGLYFLIVVGLANILAQWARVPEEPWPWRRLVAFGILCGGAFWVRNDAVFLVAAFCLAWLLTGLSGGRLPLSRRIGEISVIGTTALLIAAPWLVYNYLLFGSIVPISGISESLGVSFGQHAYLLPVKLAEHITLMLPIPADLENSSIVVLGSIFVVTAFLVGIVAVYKSSAFSNRIVILTFTIFGIELAVYYGFFFGAPYFLSRYLAPVTVIVAIGSSAGLLMGSRALIRPHSALAVPVIAGALVALALGLNVRLWLTGHHQGHFQVVEWVKQNVNEQQWVGAIQTGTLGFFHDRTINLDGKVNPFALKAKKEGAVLDYVVKSDIEYLVDWAGITGWVNRDHAEFSKHFEVLIDDSERNLGALRRVTGGGNPSGGGS